jgi:hypothetical protein
MRTVNCGVACVNLVSFLDYRGPLHFRDYFSFATVKTLFVTRNDSKPR